MRADDLAADADALAARLADRAIELLQAALHAEHDGERAALAAQEKRITRARRAVEKAAALLADDGDD